MFTKVYYYIKSSQLQRNVKNVFLINNSTSIQNIYVYSEKMNEN